MEYGLVLLWLATYFALGLVALPVAAALFPRLPDRGAGVAVAIALVLVTVPAYWVGHAAFGWPALLSGIAVLIAAALGALRRFDVQPNWRAVGDTAAVFAVAFGLMIAIRAVDPAVHPIYGEKFLDFGLLKSLLRAPVLPPEDMWFAGEGVKYYYGGHLVTSLLTILTGTEASYAYNLALSGFYAMLVTAAYGVGGAIGAARGAPRRGAGLASAFFVGFASNLATPARALAGLLTPDMLVDVAGDKATQFAQGLNSFGYWGASRAMGNGVPTEFPLFAWLNGDLHAHMMSTPFTLLVVALLVGYYRTPEEELRRRRLLVFGCVPVVGGLIAVVNTWSFPTVAGLTALALLFAPADPTTLLPRSAGRHVRRLGYGDPMAADGGGAVVTTDETATGTSRLARIERAARVEAVRIGTAGVAAVVVLAAAAAVGLPFFLGSASGREVAIWEASKRSNLAQLLVVHGGFLLVFGAFLAGRLGAAHGPVGHRPVIGLLLVLGLGVGHGFAAFGLFVPFMIAAWILLRRRSLAGTRAPETDQTAQRADGSGDVTASDEGPGETADREDTDRSLLLDPDVGFETLLVIAGAGLALIVELVYVVDQAAGGRFNTVFKTYAQVWLVWGVAAGAMFGSLVSRHVLEPAAAAARSDGDDAGPSAFAVGASLLLVLSLSLYGGLALTSHFAGESLYPDYQRADDPTLNATAFVEEGHAEEAAAIRWLDAREGRPVIVTAPGGYRWQPHDGMGASAPASLTGLPTVLGWHHEIGYRGRPAYRERKAEVDAIYTGPYEQRACLLAKHDVRYVYVGPAEETTYRNQVGDFSSIQGVGDPMQFDSVRIYPVDRSTVADGVDCSNVTDGG